TYHLQLLNHSLRTTHFFYSSLSFSPFFLFFFNAPPTTEIYTLSLHDALPIYPRNAPETLVLRESIRAWRFYDHFRTDVDEAPGRSEEHTSELQSRSDLVCRLLLEKKKKKKNEM